MQTVAEPQIHQEVHAAMPADLLGDFAAALPQRMLILLTHFLQLRIAEPTVRLGLKGNAQRIVRQNALCAGDRIDPAVGPRTGGIVLHHDGTTLVGLNHGRAHIAEHVGSLGLFARLTKGLGRIFTQTELRGTDRGQILELIAAVDVHVLGNRTQAMHRIGTPRVRLAVVQPPHPLIAVGIEFRGAQIVDICAFTVHQFAQHALAAEHQRQHLILTVTAVFQHHVVPARLLACLNQLPALIHSHRSRDFRNRMLARLHRINRHRRMPEPRCGDVDQIDFRQFDHLFPDIQGAGKDLRRLFPRLDQEVALTLRTFRNQIAHSHHFNIRNRG